MKTIKQSRFLIEGKISLFTAALGLLAFLLPLTVSAGEVGTYQQEKKLTVNVQKGQLSEVFKIVEQSSEFLFNYQDADISGIIVTVDVENGSIDNVLTQALKGTQLRYVINDRHIVVAKKNSGPTDEKGPGGLKNGKVMVSGVIMDERKTPLAGVTVFETGSTNGTTSDLDGRYKLTVSTGATVLFNFLGYEPIERKVFSDTVMDITMNSENIAIDEVVVTALGIRKEEKTLGYSLQEVKAEAFGMIKTDNPLNRLNGKVAGLTVQSRAGILEDPSIRLRGETPIYVVNGTPVSYYRGIANDDIESITILKGPQAAALYGTAGADGAILITTKNGSNATEPVTVTVNSSTMFNAGFLTLPEQQTIYGTGDFGEYSYLDGKGGGLYDGLWTWGPKLDQRDPTSASGWWETVQYNSPIDPETGQRIPTPWRSHKNNFGEFLQFGLVTDNNVTVTNKLARGSTRFSVNQMYRKGQIANSDLNRMGANFAMNYDITDRLHFNGNMNYSYTFTNNRQWSGYGNQHPYYNILVYMGANNDINDLRDYWEPGQKGYQQRSWNHVWFNNPWFVAYEYERPYSEPEFLGNFSLDYDIIDGLNILVKVAHNSKEQHSETHKPYAWVGDDYGQYNVTSNRNVRTDLDALLTYRKKFGNFELDALAGASFWQHNRNQTYATTVGGLQMPDFYDLSNSVLVPDATPENNFIQRSRMMSVYGTATLSYRSWVYLTLTGRNDWSSKLISSNRSFFYPSVSASVLLNEMIRMPRQVSLIKLRGSYAKIGRDMDPYQLENYYEFDQYWGNDNASYRPADRITDLNITPFFVTSYEMGFDMRFFDSRLRVDFSYYYNLEEGKIEEVSLAGSSAFEKMLTNANDYIRYGWEVMVGFTPIKTRNWEWKVDANWSLNRKRLHKIYNGEPMYNNFRVGDRTDALYEYVWLRDPAGNFVVTENNGRPVQDDFKRIIGYSLPDWEYGFTTSVRYKNWRFTADVSGRVGGVVRSDLNARMIQAGTHKITTDPARELDWSKGAAYIPNNAVIVTSGEIEYDSAGNVVSDTRVFEKSKTPMTYKAWIGYVAQLNGPYTMGYNLFPMDFIKLRSAAISYDFSSMLSKTKVIKGLEFSIIGNNLLIWKKLLNEDPDANYKNFSYPTERMVGFNLNVTF